MAEFVSTYAVDLRAVPSAMMIPHQLAVGDADAYVFTANVYDSQDPDAGVLSGTVTGTALRPDGGTVTISGTKGAETVPVVTTGGTCQATPCSITIPQAALAYPGRLTIAIRLVDGDTQTTVLIVSAMVTRTQSDTWIDPGEVVPDLATLIAQIERCETATEAAEEAAASVGGAVRYDQVQTLTEAQQVQARANVGADYIDYYKTGWQGHRGTAQHNLGIRRVAEPYTPGAAYAVGDYVIQDGDLYRCSVAVSEAPDDFWEQDENWVYIAPTPEPASAAALTAEADARAAADTALADDLADEVTARAAADDTLTEAVADVEAVSCGGFGRAAFGADATATVRGVRVVKNANLVTLTGTVSTGGNYNVYVTNGISSSYSSDPTSAGINAGCVLRAGRTYRLSAEIVSGSFEKSGNFSCGIRYYTKPLSGTDVSYKTVITDIADSVAAGKNVISGTIAPTEDTAVGFGLYVRPGCVFTDLVIRFSVADITYLTRTRALAPLETATASQAYAAGSLLTKNGLLYQVSSAIGAGESITPGTNVVETSVAELLTPEAGTISYVSNSYVNSGMASSSWLKVYPFGLAVLFLFIPVAAALPSDGTTITTGRVSHPPLANFGQGMSANDPSLGIVANISTDGTIQVYTKGASKPSSGWGTYSAMICYPITPFHP